MDDFVFFLLGLLKVQEYTKNVMLQSLFIYATIHAVVHIITWSFLNLIIPYLHFFRSHRLRLKRSVGSCQGHADALPCKEKPLHSY